MLAQLIIFLIISVALIAFADEIGNFLKNVKIPLLSQPFIKHAIALLAMTVLVLLFSGFFVGVVRIFEVSYSKLLYFIQSLIGTSGLADHIAMVLSLIIVASVPWLLLSAIYRLLSKKKFFPYCTEAIWISWFILITVVVL